AARCRLDKPPVTEGYGAGGAFDGALAVGFVLDDLRCRFETEARQANHLPQPRAGTRWTLRRLRKLHDPRAPSPVVPVIAHECEHLFNGAADYYALLDLVHFAASDDSLTADDGRWTMGDGVW